MEKGVFEINLPDNRKFRIFFANRTQKEKLLRDFSEMKILKYTEIVLNGTHDKKDWDKYLKELLKNA